MKKYLRINCPAILLCVFILCYPKVGCAQKYDYTWLAGYGSFGGYDTALQHWFGISKFDFNQPQVGITKDSLGIWFNRSNSIISDSDGNLLFYTNGVQIYNFADDLMQNGDSLGWGPYLAFYNWVDYLAGQPFPQLLITLPNPKLQNTFDLFYNYVDTNDAYGVISSRLLWAQVNMKENEGLGKVNFKDSIVNAGITNMVVSSVKHANGRDWWLSNPKAGSNCYNIILYDGNTSIASTMQCGGDSIYPAHTYSERFSPDGSTFVIASDQGPVSIFDFDRCSGTLNLREEFIISEIADSLDWWPTGLEFSPDSRFFYVFCQYRIFQFNIQASPIANSKNTIAKYDGFLGPNPQGYYYAQLAPDGKIYVNAGSTNYYVGVIDSPDGQGTSCNFLDHSIELPTIISGLPYYPNYRLGALNGSPCDTLSGLSDEARAAKEQIIKVFPNPSSDYVIIDYGFTDWNKGEVYLEISNALGQTVYEQVLPMYSGFQKIDVTSYASGVYVAYIKRQGDVVGAAKFAKE